MLLTTTVGSFPQTDELRQVRRDYKAKLIDSLEYEAYIKKYIKECIKFQEECGLDVLVHGEPERSDMVEYFTQYLDGYILSENGWVQSYGSRCVKPPILFGNINRLKPMSVNWISYAQSLTKKYVKGILTGPITMLNWSFVNNNLSKDILAKQLALCISDEIKDLQKAGIKIIQIDEAAFKEGYPLRKENMSAYLKLAIDSFRLAISSANLETQIHTHMCYSNFADIMQSTDILDIDVLSIESARSGKDSVKIFKNLNYSHDIAPGVYDIHSPRIPSVNEFIEQIEILLNDIDPHKLWISPDCGLKTRKYDEIKQSLSNMVQATKIVKNRLNSAVSHIK